MDHHSSISPISALQTTRDGTSNITNIHSCRTANPRHRSSRVGTVNNPVETHFHDPTPRIQQAINRRQISHAIPDPSLQLTNRSEGTEAKAPSEAKSYRGMINGHTHIFTSLKALLNMQPFMDKFKEKSSEHLCAFNMYQDEKKLRKSILKDVSLQQIFLLVNGIHELDRSALNQSNLASKYESLQEVGSSSRLPPMSLVQSNTAAKQNYSQFFLCKIKGDYQVYDSIDALMNEPQLLLKFRKKSYLYFEDLDIPKVDAELKKLINSRQDIQKAFLMINDVDYPDDISETVTSESQIENVNHVAETATGPCANVYNSRMTNLKKRQRSLTEYKALSSMQFIKTFPQKNKSVFTVSEAGFYLSLNEKKLVCFSCGGTINQWRREWGNSKLDEVHAKLYPSCAYIKKRVGQTMIDHYQQQLTDEQRQSAMKPLTNQPALYRLPITGDQRQAEEVEKEHMKFLLDWHEGRVTVDGRDRCSYDRENRAQTEPVQSKEIWSRQRHPVYPDQTSPTIGVSAEVHAEEEQPSYSFINELLGQDTIDQQPLTLASQFALDRFEQGDINNESRVKSYIQELQGKLQSTQDDSDLYRALNKLFRKIKSAQTGKNELIFSFMTILQDLIALPKEIIRELSAELFEIIDADLEGHCQDHTAEVVDQMKTRIFLVNIKQEMRVTNGINFTVLKKLKLTFNESMLFEVMCQIKSNGRALIESSESTEIRGFLKNEFSESICHFPGSRIVQLHSNIGRPRPAVMEKLRKEFTQGIHNKQAFIEYFLNLSRHDSDFKNLLIGKNPELELMYAKIESEMEQRMLEFDPFSSMPRTISEYQMMEGASNLRELRGQMLENALKEFINKKVNTFWERIIKDTSR